MIRRGLLETLGKVSICEARRINLYLRGERRSEEKGTLGSSMHWGSRGMEADGGGEELPVRSKEVPICNSDN